MVKIKVGAYILVAIEVQNSKKESSGRQHTYAAICQTDLEENEVKVLFLKSCGKNIFKPNEENASYITFKQILCLLPMPDIILQGNRISYKFPDQIDVFEKAY